MHKVLGLARDPIPYSAAEGSAEKILKFNIQTDMLCSFTDFLLVKAQDELADTFGKLFAKV